MFLKLVEISKRAILGFPRRGLALHSDLEPNPLPYVSQLWRRRFPHRMKNKWEVTHDEYSFDVDRWPSLENRLNRQVEEDPPFIERTEKSKRRENRKRSNLASYYRNKSSEAMVKAQHDQKVVLNLEEVENCRVKEFLEFGDSSFLNDIRRAAWHYGVCSDLDTKGLPSLEGRICAEFSNGKHIFHGNILTPSDMFEPPTITCDGVRTGKYLVMFVGLDGIPAILWMTDATVRNGSIRIDEQCHLPYLRPFPLRGLGFQRFALVLSKRKNLGESIVVDDRFVDFGEFARSNDLGSIVGLCFGQARWDSTVTKLFHEQFGKPEPIYEFRFVREKLPEQVPHPEHLAFNSYLDAYRDRKDINEQVLKQYLSDLCPFEGHSHDRIPYPHAEPYPDWMPSWYRKEMDAYRSRVRKYAWVSHQKAV